MRASAACRRSVAALLLAAAFAAGAASEVYRWKDENGQWHYGDRPPAGQQADVVDIAPAPSPQLQARDPDDPDADPDQVVLPGLWSEVEQRQQGLKPRTVREVQRGCSAIVNACAVSGGPDRASCLASVRQCAADPTLEKQDCCPAACSLRFAELRSQGLPEGLAFTRAVFGTPSCVPGGDAAPTAANPP